MSLYKAQAVCVSCAARREAGGRFRQWGTEPSPSRGGLRMWRPMIVALLTVVGVSFYGERLGGQEDVGVDVGKLYGVWFHSYEEDQGDRVVFRDQSYDFPRSRAPRRSLTIEPDGSVAFGAPGPADASTFTEGNWDVSKGLLRISQLGRLEVYDIESLEDTLLVLQRRAPEEGTDGIQR